MHNENKLGNKPIATATIIQEERAPKSLKSAATLKISKWEKDASANLKGPIKWYVYSA